MMILRDATLSGNEDDDYRTIRGAIYGDTRGRFKDGEYIITAGIFEEQPDNVFETMHSTYKVEFAAGYEREVLPT